MKKLTWVMTLLSVNWLISLNKAFPRIKSFLVILCIGTVPFGHITFSNPFMCLVGEIFTLDFLYHKKKKLQTLNKVLKVIKEKKKKKKTNHFNILPVTYDFLVKDDQKLVVC
jgi:hypothetical protein